MKRKNKNTVVDARLLSLQSQYGSGCTGRRSIPDCRPRLPEDEKKLSRETWEARREQCSSH